MSSDHSWHNWAGNQAAQPARVVSPRNLGELTELVKAAERDGLRLKAIGSGHSFTAIGLTDGVQVRLDRLSRMLSADQATGLVTVGAGMSLRRLNRLLEDLGLALSNLGDIDRQTVAGAISTGTHGTGRALGGLATHIRGLQLVLADGSVATCSAAERPELFSAARVGLGALGIVTAVTLQTEPSFALQARERPMPLPVVLADLDELVAGNDHFEFFWFPHTDRTLTKRNNRLADDAPTRPLGQTRAFVEDEVLSNGVFGLACRLGRAFPPLIPSDQRRHRRIPGRANVCRRLVQGLHLEAARAVRRDGVRRTRRGRSGCYDRDQPGHRTA